MRVNESDEPRRPPDLRLVASRARGLGRRAAGHRAGAAGGLVVLVGCVLLVGVTVARHRGAAWAGVVLAAGGCAAAAALVVTAHTLLVEWHPLRGPAERGAAAGLRVVVADDPRPIRTAGYGAQPGEASLVLVPARLERAEVGDGSWAAGGRVLLIAPAAEWAALLPGQAATAEGLLAPAARRDLTVAVLRVRGPPAEIAPPPWWQHAAGGLRAGLREAAGVLPPEPARAAAGAGRRRHQPRSPRRSRPTSGPRVSPTCSPCPAPTSRSSAVRSSRCCACCGPIRGSPPLLSAAAVLGFVVLARPSPSVVRAAAMAAVVLLALAMGRGRSAVPALAAAVLVLLLVDPALAVDPGFALSVLATGALVLLAPGWADALRRRGVPRLGGGGARRAGRGVPGHRAAGRRAERAGEPGRGARQPARRARGRAGHRARVCWPRCSRRSARCRRRCARGRPARPVWWLVLVADRAAAVPGAVLGWPGGLPGAVLLALLVLALLWFASLAAVAGAAARGRAGAGARPGAHAGRAAGAGRPPGWAVVACDVGQGDAVVLATGRPGWVVLVDAGPDDGPVDACLDRLGVQGIALVVLSHLHADHVGGLAGALRDRAVGGVAVGPVREPAMGAAGRRRRGGRTQARRSSRSPRAGGWSGPRSPST